MDALVHLLWAVVVWRFCSVIDKAVNSADVSVKKSLEVDVHTEEEE